MSRLNYTVLLFGFFLNILWFQQGGIGLESLITADDISLRQATCEIISFIWLVGWVILIAMGKTILSGEEK